MLKYAKRQNKQYNSILKKLYDKSIQAFQNENLADLWSMKLERYLEHCNIFQMNLKRDDLSEEEMLELKYNFHHFKLANRAIFNAILDLENK